MRQLNYYLTNACEYLLSWSNHTKVIIAKMQKQLGKASKNL